MKFKSSFHAHFLNVAAASPSEMLPLPCADSAVGGSAGRPGPGMVRCSRPAPPPQHRCGAQPGAGDSARRHFCYPQHGLQPCPQKCCQNVLSHDSIGDSFVRLPEFIRLLALLIQEPGSSSVCPQEPWLSLSLPSSQCPQGQRWLLAAQTLLAALLQGRGGGACSEDSDEKELERNSSSICILNSPVLFNFTLKCVP